MGAKHLNAGVNGDTLVFNQPRHEDRTRWEDVCCFLCSGGSLSRMNFNPSGSVIPEVCVDKESGGGGFAPEPPSEAFTHTYGKWTSEEGVERDQGGSDKHVTRLLCPRC